MRSPSRHFVSARRTAGAATVEFYLVALLAMLPLTLAILELGALFVAHHSLKHATFLAARAGALHHGDVGTMRRYLAKGLAPLFTQDRPGDGGAGPTILGIEAYGRALAEVLRPDLTRIEILNPTRMSFEDFERLQGGVRQIPNDNLRYRRESGPRSEQTIQEANLLSIRVHYCRRLIFPLIDRLITTTLRQLTLDTFAQGCYARNRVLLGGHALVQMHSAPRRDRMGL